MVSAYMGQWKAGVAIGVPRHLSFPHLPCSSHITSSANDTCANMKLAIHIAGLSIYSFVLKEL
jgi:hypothetical protein